MRSKQDVQHAFTPVAKLTEAQKTNLSYFENAYKDIASDIIDRVPESADRTSALRKLLDSKMTLSQAITHTPDLVQQLDRKKA